MPRERVAAECGLDPELLDAADARIGRPYAVVRRGLLCHEHYPGGPAQADEATEVFSVTKTLGATVVGAVAYRTRDLPRNPDARIAHVLAMLAHNEDLSFGARTFLYDASGTIQINRLSDVLNTAIAQDPDRLGRDVEEFTRRFVFEPLGMRRSRWSGGRPDKIFAYSWEASVRDMARLGLLLVHGGRWNGEQLLSAEWVSRMTHPAFEDANTGYGYLTWLNASWGYTFSIRKLETQLDPCAPVAVNRIFPHGLSEATDCGYQPPYDCEQQLDAGVWYAHGLFGQYIVGHRRLDLVLAVKDFGDLDGPRRLWDAVRPALVALDPEFRGDEAAFCARYGDNAYAPDLPAAGRR